MTQVNPFLLCYTSLIPEFYCCDGALWMHNSTPGRPRPLRSMSTPDLRKPAPPAPPAPPLRSILKNGATHRNQTLVPRDAQDGVVRPRPSSCRINEDVNVFIDDQRRRRLREHDLQVRRPKHRLSRVECEPRQL